MGESESVAGRKKKMDKRELVRWRRIEKEQTERKKQIDREKKTDRKKQIDSEMVAIKTGPNVIKLFLSVNYRFS